MNVLTSAFWGEGPSDERFLPKLLQRVIEALLFECARGGWEVLEPMVLQSQANGFKDQVEDVARKAAGLTLLFVHTDADARDEEEIAKSVKIQWLCPCRVYLRDCTIITFNLARIPISSKPSNNKS
jgi:hypothetical protein